MLGVKGLRQIPWQERCQVGGGVEFMDVLDFKQFLIFDLMISVTPPSAFSVPRVSPLFDKDQRNF